LNSVRTIQNYYQGISTQKVFIYYIIYISTLLSLKYDQSFTESVLRREMMTLMPIVEVRCKGGFQGKGAFS